MYLEKNIEATNFFLDISELFIANIHYLINNILRIKTVNKVFPSTIIAKNIEVNNEAFELQKS